MTPDDSAFVTWGRWNEAHARLGDRIKALEDKCEEIEEAQRHRADRAWMLALAFLTGLVLPLLIIVLSGHGLGG